MKCVDQMQSVVFDSCNELEPVMSIALDAFNSAAEAAAFADNSICIGADGQR